MTTTQERLEQLLDDKDQQIEELRGKLKAAERQIEYDAGWTHHRVYEKRDEAPNPELPVPRLEIRWTEHERETTAVYSLVYRHLLGHIVFVPLGQTRSSGALADRVSGSVVDMPFREASHFENEMRQLKLRGFVIAGDHVHEARLCSKCERFEESHRDSAFGVKCTMRPLTLP